MVRRLLSVNKHDVNSHMLAESYADAISDGQGIQVFVRILCRWKGSLYKLVWLDLLIYVTVYYILNLVYRFALTESQKRTFEEIVKFCDNMKTNIPLSFLLGFFVAGVIGRWWQMYMTIPWLNRISFLVQGLIVGNGPEKSRKIRMTILRYMNLSWIILMRRISDQIAIRFRLNTMKEKNEEEAAENVETNVRDIFHNVNADRKVHITFRKLITDSEIRAMENIAAQHYAKFKKSYEPEYWIPMQWATRTLQKAFVHGYISDPRTTNGIIDEIDVLRGQMQTLQIYSSIMIPLVYTQVVIIAVYSYFLCQLFGAQFVDPSRKIAGHEVDFYFPVFTIFQFLFLMGWLKVAMCVMNPFGDDDEDFQTSEILDYNLDVSYRSVACDESMYPELLKPVPFKFRLQDGHLEDNLPEFMQDMEDDLFDRELPMDDMDDNMSALEIPPTKLEKISNCFKCHSCRRKCKRSNCAEDYDDDDHGGQSQTITSFNALAKELFPRTGSLAMLINEDNKWQHYPRRNLNRAVEDSQTVGEVSYNVNMKPFETRINFLEDSNRKNNNSAV